MLKLQVDYIKHELPDTATFYLSNTVNERVNYKAGQFLTLIFNHHGEEIRRSYSLSSSPDEDLLAVTVKRIDNGEISRFLLGHIKPGDMLYAAEPAGRFVATDGAEKKDVFMFAAGSGISPLFSQIKYILSRPGNCKLHLIYSSRDRKSVIFSNELAELSERFPGRFNLVHLLSDEARRLNNYWVEQLVNKMLAFDRSKAEFYLCGPFVYMRMVTLTLLYMGIEARQIRKENFVLETVGVARPTHLYPPQKLKIDINGQLHDLQQGENQSILQAALQNNIHLPYSCRNGICSACVAHCKSGKVEMVKNEVLTEADLAEGWVLTCTGHAMTDDVVIEYRSQ